ncbi:transmembrane protein, putative (macronuclear) [Tetrahymena thermophila SB210]|uniref:Transmembrane protein, putative n=1 Tax=Tetrahymena thermophila (strain SB210) TaxID=312017 RepID=W7XDY9_TETTS|nr:transmembrane protein, putative [Tetrahymena thermophila SB210]EWS75817.1 transmembrane protein, putative [Tetrahymena thermophila SB210]|eukprot:XP_012651631.1 transmembrane protein, putative [Tetrahymena thermophila SB210]
MKQRQINRFSQKQKCVVNKLKVEILNCYLARERIFILNCYFQLIILRGITYITAYHKFYFSTYNFKYIKCMYTLAYQTRKINDTINQLIIQYLSYGKRKYNIMSLNKIQAQINKQMQQDGFKKSKIKQKKIINFLINRQKKY